MPHSSLPSRNGAFLSNDQVKGLMLITPGAVLLDCLFWELKATEHPHRSPGELLFDV